MFWKRKRRSIQKICINCRFYNENWEKEWDQKEHSWCNKEKIDILNDKESDKLGYCKHFRSCSNRDSERRLKEEKRKALII